MESHGRSWKAMEGHGRLYSESRAAVNTGRVRKRTTDSYSESSQRGTVQALAPAGGSDTGGGWWVEPRGWCRGAVAYLYISPHTVPSL